MVINSELRRGNWINSSHGKIQFDFFSNNTLMLLLEESIRPIALTPEILEKAGFEIKSNTENVISVFEYDDFYLNYDWRYRDVFEPMVLYNKEWVCYSNPIKHVHQLQNLYFALNGKELEIKSLI